LRGSKNEKSERRPDKLNIQSVLQLAPDFVTGFKFEGAMFGGDRDAVNDYRIRKLNELCDLEGKRILELGPLEGGHTLAMSKLGPREIVAVEGRPENFIKCAIIKTLYDLNNTRFVLDDLRSATLEKLGRFDICVCLGVLYHLPNPYRVLQAISAVADRVYIWTQHSSDSYPEGDMIKIELEGFVGNAKRASEGKYYSEVLSKSQAGLQERSVWFSLNDLVAAVHDAGFDDVEVLGKGMVAKKMACCLLYAKKS
jgi:hypothetical protein